MFQKDTVFVLGAGASIPYKFPSGKALVKEIIKSSHEDETPFGQLFPRELRMRFCSALDLSFAPSIDDFLEKRPEFMDVGKAAISAQLITKESPDNIARETNGNWYEFLWECMQARVDDFPNNRVRFITFNYDRSLEFFLQRTLMNYFGIPKEKANEILDQIPIVHIHGMLGSFKDGLPFYRDYNPHLTAEIIEASVKTIRVFHEKNLDANENIEKAISFFEAAEKICFLGFGYHLVNIQRISADKYQEKNMIGSAFGLAEAEKSRIRLFHPSILLGPSGQDCLQFLREYFIPE